MHIELNNFLRIKNLAATGGQAKVLIRSEAVRVNREVETRNKRKLVAGDKVEVKGKVLVVEEEALR